MRYVDTLLQIIGFFVTKLEARIAVHEAKAIAFGKQIEALEQQKVAHFTEAIRIRNLSAKFREFVA